MDEHQSNGQEIIVQPTENIVEIDGGNMFTTSLTVAQAFEKEHFNVLRDIEKLECSETFRALNFEATEYQDAQGKMRPAYRMTRDGFSFLAMGFTGKKAAAWKEKFLEAFNAMEQTLLDQQKDSIMEQAQEQEALPKEAQPIPYFFRSRKRIGKGGRAALEGILRLEALLQGDSLEHTEQRLCARMHVKSVGDLQECRLQEAIIYVFEELFRVGGQDGWKDTSSTNMLLTLQGLVDFWGHFSNYTKTEIRTYICNRCGVDNFEELKTEHDLFKAVLAAWSGFSNHNLKWQCW